MNLVDDLREDGVSPNDQADGPLVTAENRRIAEAILADLLPTDQQQWWLALTRWNSGRKVPQVPSSIESVSITLRSLDDISGDSRGAWEEMLRAFSSFVERDDVDGDTGNRDTVGTGGVPVAGAAGPGCDDDGTG